MTDCDDLHGRARANPASLKFEELCALAECFGWKFARQRGTSHRLYKRTRSLQLMNFQADRNGMGKPYQVRQLLAAIEQRNGPEASNGEDHGRQL